MQSGPDRLCHPQGRLLVCWDHMRAPMIIEDRVVRLTHVVELETLLIVEIVFATDDMCGGNSNRCTDIGGLQSGLAMVIPGQRGTYEDGAAEDFIWRLQWAGQGVVNHDRRRKRGALREAHNPIERSVFLHRRQDQLARLGKFPLRADPPFHIDRIIIEVGSIEELTDI